MGRPAGPSHPPPLPPAQIGSRLTPLFIARQSEGVPPTNLPSRRLCEGGGGPGRRIAGPTP